MFPKHMLKEVEKNPHHYKLLSLVPLLIPANVKLGERRVADVPDTCLQKIVILDCETTGLDPQVDEIIELGMVAITVDSRNGKLMSIDNAVSVYREPSVPISEFITQLTGITSADVAGKSIDEADIAEWFDAETIVIAHNAGFDRAFFDNQFPGLSQLKWACSVKDVSWRELGFESSKLEYLLLKSGYFYEGHRADTDCYALLWLFILHQDALMACMAKVDEAQYLLSANNAPFEVKDMLKAAGYKWNDVARVWQIRVDDTLLNEHIAWLTELYPQAQYAVNYQLIDPLTRYQPG